MVETSSGAGAELTLAERMTALESACTALEGIGDRLWEAGEQRLGELLRRVDELARKAEATRFRLVVEIVERGVGGKADVEWIAEHSPHTRPAQVKRMLAAARTTRQPAMEDFRSAVLTGRITVDEASACVSELEKLLDRLQPEAVPTVREGLITVCEADGIREMRKLRPALIAKYGHAGELDDLAVVQARRRALSAPWVDEDGMASYRLILDPEGQAVVESAMGALAAPRPDQDGPDPRPTERRRADALIEIIRRGGAYTDHIAGKKTAAKTQLVLSMSLADLIAGLGSATTLADTTSGHPLPPGVVRRLSCEAEITPIVLGTKSEILDLGSSARLFTPGQVKALWARDMTCTFPRCCAPGIWADAHHLIHWAHGGPTNLGNGALLCQRHHTHVHDKDLYGWVGPDGQVHWDTTPGSYTAHRVRAGPAAA
ncbi:MAG: HNH endonuclease [Micrococcales bacterium]|nr:HNH endonuclease [Micrococcales bacterium]